MHTVELSRTASGRVVTSHDQLFRVGAVQTIQSIT